MRLFITGANGQLGSELIESIKGHEVYAYDRKALNIVNLEDVYKCVLAVKPDIIVNCAAYTNVDKAESDYVTAFNVNTIGCANLAIVAKEVDARLIHVSTDFVFDGSKTTPYFEYDSTTPLGVYGQTKLAGEWEIRKRMEKYFIIRTSWLYGKNGNNFVKTMIRLGKEKDYVSVVTDQVGSPTLTTDLISAIIACFYSNAYGLYHFSNTGICSWNEFAKEIFMLMKIESDVLDITSKDFVRDAKRPAYSVLDTRMIQSALNLKIRNWKNALAFCLKEQRTSFDSE
jgi:dTDP-4-dehydrorhamnose reductase